MTEVDAATAAESVASLKQQLACFARDASIEITPDDAAWLPQLRQLLPEGMTVYVAHTPKLTLEDVVRFSARVEEAGFRACAHVVARACGAKRSCEARSTSCALRMRPDSAGGR